MQGLRVRDLSRQVTCPCLPILICFYLACMTGLLHWVQQSFCFVMIKFLTYNVHQDERESIDRSMWIFCIYQDIYGSNQTIVISLLLSFRLRYDCTGFTSCGIVFCQNLIIVFKTVKFCYFQTVFKSSFPGLSLRFQVAA